MLTTVVNTLLYQWHKGLAWLRLSWQSQVQPPAFQLILQTLHSNLGWLLLLFGANLLSPILEGSTFGLILLALESLRSDRLPDVAALPFPLPAPLIDLAQQLTPGGLFISLVLLALGLQVCRSGITYLGIVASTYLATKIEAQVQSRVYSQILSLSFPCVSHYKVGDLIDYVTQPSAYVRLLVLDSNNLLVCLLLAMAYLVVLFLVSLPLTLVAVVLFGPLIFFQKALMRRIIQTSQQLTRAYVVLSERIVESLQALRLIHILDRQPWVQAGVELTLADAVRFNRRRSLLTALAQPVNEIVTMVAIGIFAISGYVLLSRDHAWFLPQLLVFIAACNRLAGQVRIANTQLASMAQSWGPIARLNQILTPDDKQFRRQGGQLFTSFQQEIKFEQVSLVYSQANTSALKQLSFTIHRHTVTAFVGASGAGKSSIVDLLLGLYTPTSGRIYIDGTDLNHLDLATWRQSLGVVSQDTFVFNASVADNIRFGWLEATDEQVIAAAQTAQAHEFILQLPHGYDTVLGEQGFRLSGGQRQRLALARAILRQPEILILDEATSALDSHSEKLVQQALVLFQSQRTVLAIAHRLATIVHADQILVLDQGQLVEQGTHQTLLQQKGCYAYLWQLQSEARTL